MMPQIIQLLLLVLPKQVELDELWPLALRGLTGLVLVQDQHSLALLIDGLCLVNPQRLSHLALADIESRTPDGFSIQDSRMVVIIYDLKSSQIHPYPG